MKNKAIQTGSDFLNNTIKFFKELPAKTWNSLLEIIQNVKKWGDELIKNTKIKMKDFCDKTIEIIKELPQKFIDVGKDIISGLWNGFKNGITGFFKNITDFGNSVITKVKGIFDIHSPSRVFHEIGGFIIQGLGDGINDKSEYPIEEMERVGKAILSSGNEISTGLVTLDKSSGNLIFDNTYTTIMKKIDLFQKEKDKRLVLLNKGTEDTIKAIDEEIKATENAYNIKMKLMEQEYLAKASLIDKESADGIKLINDKINAMNKEKELEKKAEEEARYSKEVSDKENEIAKLQSDTAEYLKAKEELEKIKKQREKQLLEEQREAEKEALSQQIEDIRDKANAEKEALNEEEKAKKFQLEQQKTDELTYLGEMQKHLKTDLENRKELETVQTQIKQAEQEKRSKKEIEELKARELEIIKSLKNNKVELDKFAGVVESVSKQYGSSLYHGFKSTESSIKSYLNNITQYAKDKIDEITSSASNMQIEFREVKKIEGKEYNSNNNNQKEEKNIQKEINVIQNFYTPAENPREQQRKAKKELERIAW